MIGIDRLWLGWLEFFVKKEKLNELANFDITTQNINVGFHWTSGHPS
jgi:hypothetical protein